ncbi:hypothetical protein ACFL4G_10955 [Thermodesulfobacteriota bacterium]
MNVKFETKVSDPFTKFDDEVKSFHILNERKANFTRFLKMAEKNRGSVKPHIYEKVTADYDASLADVLREWKPLVEGIVRKLQDFNDEKDNIEREIIEATDSLDELRFRTLVGEFEEEQVREKETVCTESIEDLRLRLSVLQRKIDYYKDLKAEIPPDDMPADLDQTEPAGPAATSADEEAQQDETADLQGSDRESTRTVNLGFQGGARPRPLPVGFSGGEQPQVDPAFDLESPAPEESPEPPADRSAAGGSGDTFEILDEGFDEESLPVLELKLDR